MAFHSTCATLLAGHGSRPVGRFAVDGEVLQQAVVLCDAALAVCSGSRSRPQCWNVAVRDWLEQAHPEFCTALTVMVTTLPPLDVRKGLEGTVVVALDDG